MRQLLLGLATSLLFGVSAHADPGAWEVTDKIAPLDGTHNFVAAIQADNTVASNRNRMKQPILAIIFNQRRVAMRIVWPDHIATEPNSTYFMDFFWKLDDGAPKKEMCIVDTKFAFALYGDEAIRVLRLWRGGKVLVVRVPDGHGGQDAVFQIAGFDDVVAQLDKDITADNGGKP